MYLPKADIYLSSYNQPTMATIVINTQKIFFSSYHRFVAGGSGVVLLGMGLSWHGFIVQRDGPVVKKNPATGGEP